MKIGMPKCRLAALAAAVGFCFAQSVTAGVITFFSDRANWEAAATIAGLTITTEDFSVEPPAYPDLTVGGIDFTVGIRTGILYDAANQRIGYTSGGGRTLSLDFTGGSPMLFGFGLDLGPTVGNVGTTDVDGASIADGTGSAVDHFVGLLGTAAFDPSGTTNEFGTSGLGASVYFDNLSVATGVIPEPATLNLLGLGLAGIGLARRKRTH